MTGEHTSSTRLLIRGLPLALLWLYAALSISLIVGLVVQEVPFLLWPSTSGIITAEGETYSYAVRDNEYINGVVSIHGPGHPLPPPGERVAVRYNPLAPEHAYLTYTPPLFLSPWVMVVLAGGVIASGAALWLGRAPSEDYKTGFALAALPYELTLIPAVLFSPLALLFVTVASLFPGWGDAAVGMWWRWGFALSAAHLASLALMWRLGPFNNMGDWTRYRSARTPVLEPKRWC